MRHKKFESLIVLNFYGENLPEDKKNLDSHLLACPKCKKFQQDIIKAIPRRRPAEDLNLDGTLLEARNEFHQKLFEGKGHAVPAYKILRYAPAAFFSRVARLARALDVSHNRYRSSPRRTLRDLRSFGQILRKLSIQDRQTRGPLTRALLDCLWHNPRALRMVVSLAALYLHYGPFARQMDQRLKEQIESLRRMGEAVVLGPVADPVEVADSLCIG